MKMIQLVSYLFKDYAKFILGMPTFREPCSPLHQVEEQPDTELFLQIVPFYITLFVGWGKRRETLAFQEWIWTEETRGTHNLYSCNMSQVAS